MSVAAFSGTSWKWPPASKDNGRRWRGRQFNGNGTVAGSPNPDTPATVGLSLQLERAALAPLVAQVVEETLRRLDESRTRLSPERLAYSEAEAARLLGLAPHQLRDERLRGRISASQVVGKRVRYLREDLIDYLMKR